MSSITKDLPYPYRYAHWLCVLMRAKSMAYEDRLEAAKQCLAEGKVHGIVNLLELKKPLDTKGFTYRYDTKLARVIRDTIPKVEIEEIPKPKAPPKPIEIPVVPKKVPKVAPPTLLEKSEQIVREYIIKRTKELLENEYSKEYLEDLIRTVPYYIYVRDILEKLPERFTPEELQSTIKQYDERIIRIAIEELMLLPTDFVYVYEIKLTPYSIGHIKGELKKFRDAGDWLGASEFYYKYVHKPYRTYKEIIDTLYKLQALDPITKEEAEKLVQALKEYPQLKESRYIKDFLLKIRRLPEEEFRALEVSPYYIIFQELGVYEIAGRAPHYHIETNAYIFYNLMGIFKEQGFTYLIPDKNEIISQPTVDRYLKATLLYAYIEDAKNIYDVAFEIYADDLFRIFRAIRPKKDQDVELIFNGFRDVLTIRYDGREHETHIHVEDIKNVPKLPEQFKDFTPNFRIMLTSNDLEKALQSVSRYGRKGVIIVTTTRYGYIEEVYLVDSEGNYREVLSPLEAEVRGEQKWASIDLRMLSTLFPYLRRMADVCTIEADTEKGIYRLIVDEPNFRLTLYDVSPYVEKVPEITEREEVFEGYARKLTEMISIFQGRTAFTNVAPREIQLYHPNNTVIVLRVRGNRSDRIREDLYLIGDFPRVKLKLPSNTIKLVREKENYRLYTGNNELLGTFYEGKGDFNVNQIREMVEGDLVLGIDPELLLNIIRNIEVTRTSGLMVVKEDGVYAKAGFEEGITYELELPESAEIFIHVVEPKIIPMFSGIFSDLKKLCQIAKNMNESIGIMYRKSIEGHVIIFRVSSDNGDLYLVVPYRDEDVEPIKRMCEKWLERLGV